MALWQCKWLGRDTRRHGIIISSGGPDEKDTGMWADAAAKAYMGPIRDLT